jgi:hypothetical protein
MNLLRLGGPSPFLPGCAFGIGSGIFRGATFGIFNGFCRFFLCHDQSPFSKGAGIIPGKILFRLFITPGIGNYLFLFFDLYHGDRLHVSTSFPPLSSWGYEQTYFWERFSILLQ